MLADPGSGVIGVDPVGVAKGGVPSSSGVVGADTGGLWSKTREKNK